MVNRERRQRRRSRVFNMGQTISLKQNKPTRMNECRPELGKRRFISLSTSLLHNGCSRRQIKHSTRRPPNPLDFDLVRRQVSQAYRAAASKEPARQRSPPHRAHVHVLRGISQTAAAKTIERTIPWVPRQRSK